MKPPALFAALAAAWVAFLAFDNAAGLMRGWYLRHMRNPFRSAYAVARYGRSLTIFILGILNMVLVFLSIKKKDFHS